MSGEPLPVRPGQVIGARYRVDRVLGQSGMAVVVAARDEQLDEVVAIKILLSQRVANSEVRARFGREARGAVKIKGEHVARVLDVGALPDGTPYMVMEYLEGESLAALLERRGPVPGAAAILYAMQVCDALREAHAIGVVHRHLEPRCLFMAKRRGRPPTLKVLDFGISKVEPREAAAKAAGGLARYMAPEQLKSAPSVEARSDIWSVGVILYELVTGELPFGGTSQAEIVANVLNATPNLRAAPKELEPVIRRCLAKAPAGRYANVSELVAALTALEGLPLVAIVRPSLSAPDTVKEPPRELVVGDDEAELMDEDEDDGEVVDETELLPSAPPPKAAEPQFPKGPPRLLVMPPPERPAWIPPPAPARAPAPAPAGAVAQSARSTPTDRPPPKELAAPPPPSVARRRRLLFAAAIVVVPLSFLAAARMMKKPKPEPTIAATTSAVISPVIPVIPVVPVNAPVAQPDASLETAQPVASASPPPPPSPPAPAPEPPAAQARKDVPPPPPRPPPKAAVAAPVARPEAMAAPAAPAATKPADDATVAVQVAMRNHGTLRQACWDTSDKTTQVVSVSASVDPTGSVSSANASSADAKLAQCVAAQVKGWSFPPSGAPRSLQIPIRFRR